MYHAWHYYTKTAQMLHWILCVDESCILSFFSQNQNIFLIETAKSLLLSCGIKAYLSQAHKLTSLHKKNVFSQLWFPLKPNPPPSLSSSRFVSCSHQQNETSFFPAGLVRALKMTTWAGATDGYCLLRGFRGQGLPRWCSGKEFTCQCRRHKRHGFDPWEGKIPWRRTWQPTPVFLSGKSQRQRSLVGNSP